MKKLFLVLLIFLLSILSVYSATYYVKNGGNDNADGLSDATAWSSVSKVNGFNFQTGDDVYFKAGDEWNARLLIEHSGTASNRVIVGSYYMGSGQEKIGIPSNGERPLFRGNFEGSKDIDLVSNTGAIPWSFYSEMIGIGRNNIEYPVSYITVENFRIENSAGNGIGMPTRNKNSNNIIIRNNVVKHTAASCIRTDGYDTVVENNFLYECDPKQLYYQYRDRSLGTGAPCIILHGRRGIAQNNFMEGCYFEGIGSYKNEGYNIIRDNLVIGPRKVGIYPSESSNNIIERNVIIGDYSEHTIGTAGDMVKYVYSNSGSPGPALESNSEWHTAEYVSDDNYFRNNIVINMGSCLKTATTSQGEALGKTSEGFYYNNLCVSNVKNVERSGGTSYVMEVKNNLLMYTEIGDSSQECQQGSFSDYDFNYWNIRPSNSNCRGSNDIEGGFDLDRTSGWKSFGIGNIPDLSEFYLKSNSIVRDKGTDLRNQRVLNKDDYFDYPMNGNCVFDETKNSYDFYCNPRDSTPDLGPFEYGSDPSTGGGYDGDGASGSSGSSGSNSCHQYTAGSSIPDGFGAPFFPDSNNLFFRGSCSDTSISARVDSSDLTYVYENGYYWDGNSWQLVQLQGQNVDGSPWIGGGADYTVSGIDTSDTNYLLTYACKWTGTLWKCGCRDLVCNENYWNLQVFTK